MSLWAEVFVKLHTEKTRKRYVFCAAVWTLHHCPCHDLSLPPVSDARRGPGEHNPIHAWLVIILAPEHACEQRGELAMPCAQHHLWRLHGATNYRPK